MKNLVIVESPAKAKTIEKYLGQGFVVTSSMGHIRDLIKGDGAIEIANNFKPNYEVSEDKRELVKKLKKMVAENDQVWLATDDDREGEAISWHLAQVLGLDTKTTKRIVFNEITEHAIKKAIENPRTIDTFLVDAQQARRVLDRIVGYELSPVLWKKIKANLSAGRVQSVSVRLVVEREREINKHTTESSFKVKILFAVGNKKIEAECPEKFATAAEVEKLFESLILGTYSISNIEVKQSYRNPSAPFTTSTLQQEASRKLGYDVSKTMRLAQRLYENGHITYMRTDSTNLSQLAINTAKAAIIEKYGVEYSNPRNYSTKNENAQEAHEAIRPTYFTAERAGEDPQQSKLYELIWKRALASQMNKAELERTLVTVNNTNSKYPFIAEGEVIKFDGFLKLYMESKDDEEDEESAGILPPVKKGQQLEALQLIGEERFTKPAARYTEASLVKKLEELGIGRPSTYAPTITTIQNRGYIINDNRDGGSRLKNIVTCVDNIITTNSVKENFGFEKKKLFPTDIGIIVTDFLLNNFSNIMDYGFTASVEKQFDEIADGLKSWTSMLEGFYDGFHVLVEKTTEHAERATGEKILGKDPKTGKTVLVRIGRFGPLVQIGQKETDGEDVRFVSLPANKSIETISLEDSLALFELPRTAAMFNGEPVELNVGRYGPYMKYNGKFYSLPKTYDLLSMSEEEVLMELEVNLSAPQFPLVLGEYKNQEVSVNKGRFGPYIKFDAFFISIPKGETLETITLEKSMELIDAKIEIEKGKILKTFTENADIQILKGRWGAYIGQGKNNYKLPKDTNLDTLTFKDVEKIIASDTTVSTAKKGAAKKATTNKVVTKKAPAKKKVAAKKKVVAKKK